MTTKSSDGKGTSLKPGLNLVSEVVNACLEAKGSDILVLDVSKTFSLSDYFVIVSGRSDRQVQGISNKILTLLEEKRVKPYAVEGQDQAHWVLMDYGDVVVHVFYEPVRSYYALDSLWGHARKVDITKELMPLEVAVQAA